jgi:hypothetical protein
MQGKHWEVIVLNLHETLKGDLYALGALSGLTNAMK